MILIPWAITTAVIPLVGIGLGVYYENPDWLLLCFAPVLWAVDWKHYR